MRNLLAAACLVHGLGLGAALADSIGDVRTGNAAFGDGRYDAAVEAFSRAILAGDLEPEALAITFNNRGVAYSELGDYDRAIQDYQQALSLVPKDPTAIKNLRIAHVRRAAAAARLGDQDAALADYDRAIELEPDHALAYLRRGQLQLDRGDKAAAIADLERARQLDPDNRDIEALLTDARNAPTVGGQAVAAATQPATTSPPAQAAPEPAPAPAPAPSPQSQAAENDYSIDPPAAERPLAVEPAAGPVRVARGGTGQPYRALADVNLRQGPGNDFPRIGALGRGTTVEVVGERLGWLEIRLSGGGSGYVYRKWLEPAGPP